MISYQKAEIDDVPEIKKLLYKSWSTAYSEIYTPKEIKTVTSYWHSIKLLTKQILNPKIIFIVAKHNKKIVGICNAIFKQKNNLLNIQKLHVDPSYHHQGIGSILIKKVINAFPQTFPQTSIVTLEVEKENHQALSFYHNHGFKEVGIKVFIIKNIHMPCLVMKKSI